MDGCNCVPQYNVRVDVSENDWFDGARKRMNRSIVIENLTFSYGDKELLTDLSMVLAPGSKTGIMGPSGSGKTTLLHLIAGLLKPESGRIFSPEEALEIRFSMVFQDGRLVENLNVLQNIRMVNESLGEGEIQQMLEALELGGYGKKKVRRLSGGERQRIAILRALAADYDVLLLDEPFSGLDRRMKQIAAAFICEKSLGKTLVLVTHDKEEAKLLGADVLELQECMSR